MGALGLLQLMVQDARQQVDELLTLGLRQGCQQVVLDRGQKLVEPAEALAPLWG